ncbi:alkaline phosphatase family protein [Citrobacter freundii]|uniref:alkaline phosphatase D family protein n=1 Tax=Citrobacter freundii TaxID=546 RepID=UPI0015EA6DF3|nr:alkaline phosphatase D family protein [Citrobacter freundii]QMD25604.1 alkaline phosphatase family protein [Citrobacter freundii]WFW14969.1 alkaline phosphatase family protein [Citrobacter freundii]
MKLSRPTVGPIVGFTTPNESRIWFRGQFEPVSPNSYRRCFGVIRWGEKTKKVTEWSSKVGKLSPNFDMTGVFPVTGLKAECTYQYQVGWFLADSELDAARTIIQFDWSDLETFTFTAGTTDQNRSRVYAVGSCRYLLRLFGGLIFDDRGDKTFESILELHKKTQVNAVLMVGDQIYADDLKFMGADRDVQSFLNRYQAAFTQENIARLMSQIPTYMILDDHEIEDNWPSHASSADMVTKYPSAIHAYQIYQASHSPVFSLDNSGWITGTPTHLWYTFSDGCADWFVMDVRTERIWNDDPLKRQMIKQSQMKALLDWLAANPGRVKMIVSSVPFFPDLNSDAEDKWGGYQRERTQILDYILQNKIRKVCFVSGDVHCSFTTQLTSPVDKDFRVLSIISSSLFWPYPHMEQNDFVLKGALTSNSQNQYTVTSSTQIYSEDNFARLEVFPDAVTVTFYERKGSALGRPIKLVF